MTLRVFIKILTFISQTFLCSYHHISHLLLYSQVLTAEQQRALCRIGAITRGFLTRRLLKIDKVKHLRQTIVVRLNSHIYTKHLSYNKYNNNLMNYSSCGWLRKKTYVYTFVLYVCVLRIHKSSSVHSRLKLHRREAAFHHKISPCRRELEPRYEVQFLSIDSRGPSFFVFMCVCPLFLSYVRPFMTSMKSSLKCLWKID